MQIKGLLFAISLLFITVAKSQNSSDVKPLRIAVFAQLYLDSAFTKDGLYKHDLQMPKYMLPGLDFTEGLLLALDTIPEAENVEVRLYDLRDSRLNISSLKKEKIFDSISLIIGAVTGNDYRQLSAIALQYQIPFLSATFPNDGGITQNPFTILLNPTISAHCNALIQFLLQYQKKSNLILLQKKGIQDEKIKNHLEIYNRTKTGKKYLNWSQHIASDSFKTEDIVDLLDSTRQNIIMCGSFDENLAIQCLNTSSSLKTYKIQYIGPPNWETMKELQLPKHKDKTIYYSTSFYNDGSSEFVNFQKIFLTKTEGKASDISFRGYDVAINFIPLLIHHKNDFINQLNDTTYQKLIEYNIQPVFLNKGPRPDYFENKNVYIIKKSNGISVKMGKF
ncbi:MAG: hypothetical protein ACK55K_06445 [Bacteroidota bacterium]